MLIDLKTLFKKYQLEVNGVIHIGAHEAEEYEVYSRVGINKIIWIEANEKSFESVRKKIGSSPNQKVYNVLVSDVDNQLVSFNIASNTQCSSILDLGSHSLSYPSVSHIKKILRQTTRLDTFLKKNEPELDFNFLNIDIQGAELLALRGAGEFLGKVDYIYTEVNLIDVYKGCSKLHQLDYFLGKNGFKRVEIALNKAHWGDAFYIRDTNSQFAMIPAICQSIFLELGAKIQHSRDKFYNFRNSFSND